MPLFIAVALSMLISSIQPAGHGTLAYATEMSSASLLEATNAQRQNSGKPPLQLNQDLAEAAQAKAQDMVSRNYWSHNTPDGQEPWVFVGKAGYQYLKAGENLAYGFLTSSETVNGWMNSPTHRDNLLDGLFSEVGFGFSNGNNFNNSGPETVVVAMYGRPKILGAADQAAQPVQTASQQSPALPMTAKNQTVKKPVTTESPVINIAGEGLQPVSRVAVLAGSTMPWATFAVGLLAGAAVTILLAKHSLGLRHLIRNSERFVWRKLHNPFFDSLLIGIIIVALTLSGTVGFII